jgi:hypothetical protein
MDVDVADLFCLQDPPGGDPREGAGRVEPEIDAGRSLNIEAGTVRVIK